jgi:hypothetical protein
MGTTISLGTSQDAIIMVDGLVETTSGTSTPLGITNGRNVHIVGVNGGRFRDTRGGTNQKIQVLRQDARGHTMIDSLFFDAPLATDLDQVVIRGYAPFGTNRAGWFYPKTYIQNCRFEGALWSGGSVHPDAFQKQTAMGSTYFYNVSIGFVYQGLMISNQSFSLDNPAVAGLQQEYWVEGLKNGSPSVDGELRIEKVDIFRTVDTYTGAGLWVGWNTNEGSAEFPGDDNYPVFFDGEDNWIMGGSNPADNITSGGGLAYPTGLGYYNGSHVKNGTLAINSVPGSDGISPYVTWVPAAQITGKLRYGDRPSGNHVTAASLSGYDSPYAV